MAWLSRLGLVVVFCAAVALTFFVFQRDNGAVEHAGTGPVQVALSVPVEIIHDGEDPSLREIEVTSPRLSGVVVVDSGRRGR